MSQGREQPPGARDTGAWLEHDSGVPSSPSRVFAPGEEALSQGELRALSPQETRWHHRSLARLADALIMMVDDEVLNIEMVQSLLLDAGYRQFVETTQPERAVEMMRRQPPAILLLDLHMPKVGGLEILAAMREDPTLRHVPAIVLTSSTDPQARLRALALGAMDFLPKPVDPSELGLRIRNTLAASAYRTYLSEHDALTGLPNKQRYREAIAEVLDAARQADCAGALLHVGVDGLGRINDALGRTVGDQLLHRIAKRLASCVQTEAGGELSSGQHDPTLYRFDGDEFAVLVPHMDGMHGAAAFINKLLEDSTVRLQRPDAPELFVTCSIGVSVFPIDGTDADLLVRNAGLALRHAKQAGPHRCEFFSPNFNEQARSRLDLSAELRHAIRRDELELLFQPCVEVATGKLVTADTLVRWKLASGRIVAGDELADLAAGSEMGVAITEWALEQLQKHLKNWRTVGLQPVPLGVRVSLATMRPTDLAHLVNAAIAGGIDARGLSLELQQLGAIDDLPAGEAAAMQALRKRGVRLALDRFGHTASVAHLRKLMCDEIRVDPSFLADLQQEAAVQAMLLGIGDLARRLRVPCVACGVDTQAQLAFLQKHGWDQAQGALFDAPLTGLAFAAKWLTRSGKPVRAALPAEGA